MIRRLLVGLLGMIDSVVYDLAGWIYGLLIDIARATPFSETVFSDFAGRIYALLGLFMIFKVCFSLIKYIVNPDEFNDKAKGGKKMIWNVLMVLILVIATPKAFDLMREAQKIILEENVLEKLILGASVTEEPIEIDKMGDMTKMAVFTSFYRPDDEDCASADMTNAEAFEQACSSYFGSDRARSIAEIYTTAYQEGDVMDMIHADVEGEPMFMLKQTSGDGYLFNYMFIVSTVVGVVLALLFLSFCFDIAVRTVKLGFLEIISPIPIISYIDPDSAKKGMFSKWVKEVGKTFADLFIRLGAVYLAITLIAMVMQAEGNLGTSSFLVKVFIILGILLFAKQIPKLLGDLFGVKLDGNFSLNPMSKLREVPVAGALAAGAAGAVGGAIAGVKAGREVGQKGFLGGAVGAISGANQMAGKVGFSGAKPGSQSPKAFSGAMNSVFKNMTNRELANLNPSDFVMKRSVQGRLDAVKKARNNASSRLTAAQVTQEAAYNQMQQSAGAVNRLSAEDKKAFLEKVNYYTEQSKIRDDMTKSQAERSQAGNKMRVIQDEINRTYTGQYEDVAKHFNDRVAAQEANSAVTAIQRDIDDLSKEKSQIERFGHIDSAATRDVDTLLERYASAPEDKPLTSPGSGGDTLGGVSVSRNSNGERTTPGGIILGNDVKRNNNGGNGNNR